MHISTKCSIALHCLVFIRQYGADNRVTSALLSRSTGCNPAAVRSILSALKKEGLVETRPGGGAALACLPKEITLLRVCRAVDPDFLRKLMGVHPAPSPLCPVGRTIHQVLDRSYDRVRRDLTDSLVRITLADLLADHRQALEAERR